MNNRFPILLILVSLLIAAILYVLLKNRPEFDLTALLAADAIMLLLSLGAWTILRKTVAERPQAFVRGVYGASMLRIFACLIGIVSYALAMRPNLHKPTLFVMFGIYAVFTILETTYFSRTAKQIQS